MMTNFFSDMRWHDGQAAHRQINNLQTSTPKVGQPPPLSTPATSTRYQSVESATSHRKTQQALTYDVDNHEGIKDKQVDPLTVGPPPPLQQIPIPDSHAWLPPIQSADDFSVPHHQRGETEGGNDLHANFAEPSGTMNQHCNIATENEVEHYRVQPHENGYMGIPGNNQQMSNVNAYQQGVMSTMPSQTYNSSVPAVYAQEKMVQNANQFHGYNDPQIVPGYVPMPGAHYQSGSFPISPPSRLIPNDGPINQRQDSFENYKVQYGKSKPAHEEVEVISSLKNQDEVEFLAERDPSLMPRPTTPGGESEEEKPEFFKQSEYIYITAEL